MKSNLSYIALSILLLVGSVNLFGAGNNYTLPLHVGNATSVVSGTYANSQVDTIVIAREAGLAGASFSIYYGDSVSITSVVARKAINNTLVGVVSADTLAMSGATTAAGAKHATVTLTPNYETLWVFVTYAASANGVTSPTVRYGWHRQYYKY